MIEFDASDLHRLEVVLGKAEAKAAAGMYAVLKRGAHQIKEGMAKDAEGIGHAPSFPASIGYDIYPGGLRTIVARIGPDKDRRQGALGNILYFGTSKNAPVRDIGKALKDETPKVERALLELGDL